MHASTNETCHFLCFIKCMPAHKKALWAMTALQRIIILNGHSRLHADVLHISAIWSNLNPPCSTFGLSKNSELMPPAFGQAHELQFYTECYCAAFITTESFHEVLGLAWVTGAVNGRLLIPAEGMRKVNMSPQWYSLNEACDAISVGFMSAQGCWWSYSQTLKDWASIPLLQKLPSTDFCDSMCIFTLWHAAKWPGSTHEFPLLQLDQLCTLLGNRCGWFGGCLLLGNTFCSPSGSPTFSMPIAK